MISASNTVSMLENIDGLGPKAIHSIIDFFSNDINKETIKNLKNHLSISFIENKSLDNFFSNKHLVLLVLYLNYQEMKLSI